MNLTDKVALVTGAGSGIGRAVALRLAAAGAKVMVADFNEEAGARTCAELKKSGAEAASRRTDVSKTEEVQELIAFTIRTFGRLDCAVNNAGIQGELASTADCSEENWDRIVDTNLKGVFLCMKYELREMLRTRQRRNREHRFELRVGRFPADARLFGQQTRGGGPYQNRGDRGCGARDSSERGMPRTDLNAACGSGYQGHARNYRSDQ